MFYMNRNEGIGLVLQPLLSNPAMILEKLCKLDLPPKIKFFLWKIMGNFVATRVNLFQRKVVPDRTCSIYAVEEETLEHVCLGVHGVKKFGFCQAYIIPMNWGR